MTIQTVPAFLQNASHSAAVFRQAASSPWQTPGVIAAGELAVGAQTTPNMSVLLGAGRAVVAGSQVSAPTLLSGAAAAFTTQAMYYCLNDGPVTVTIAAANPTNPRIDTVYLAVQDSFYSGATNAAVLGVVTGTASASPVAPSAPSNSLVLGFVAVAANATSIVAGNITAQPAVATLQGSSDTGWITVGSAGAAQFQAGWAGITNAGVPWNGVNYRVRNGRVDIHGPCTKTGGFGSLVTAFIMPANMKPSVTAVGMGLADGTAAYAIVTPAGEVKTTNSGTSQFTIGVSYPI